MRSASIFSLLVGIGIGFAPMYIWMEKRAPEVLKAMPAPSQLQQLQEKLKQNPKSFEVLAEIGDLQFNTGQMGQAVKWYTKALDVQDNFEVRKYLGIALYNDNQVDDAILQFNRMLQSDPSNPDLLYFVGAAQLSGKNDPAGAIEVWEKLIRLNPNYPKMDVVRRSIESAKEKLK